MLQRKGEDLPTVASISAILTHATAASILSSSDHVEKLPTRMVVTFLSSVASPSLHRAGSRAYVGAPTSLSSSLLALSADRHSDRYVGALATSWLRWTREARA